MNAQSRLLTGAGAFSIRGVLRETIDDARNAGLREAINSGYDAARWVASRGHNVDPSVAVAIVFHFFKAEQHYTSPRQKAFHDPNLNLRAKATEILWRVQNN